MNWNQVAGLLCRRHTLAALVVTSAFLVLLVCYSVMSSHHQTLGAYVGRHLTQVDKTKENIYRIFSTEYEDMYEEDLSEQPESPPDFSDLQSTGDLHPCRVKVILDGLGHPGSRNDSGSWCSRVIYNRVPKCGSRTVLGTLRILSTLHNYNLIAVEKPNRGKNYFSEDDLLSFVENFTEYQSPLVYSQHLHFVDFTKFHRENPLYINVIRDPVQRQISHYYYHQFGSSNRPKAASDYTSMDDCVERGKGFCLGMNAILPFFCGQDKMCRTRTEATLKKAKRVASENVLVLGFTEDLPAFMEVLEYLLPNYFAGAVSVFNKTAEQRYNSTKTSYKPKVKPETIRALQEHLSLEYDFYNFAKQRFYNLLRRVRQAKRESSFTDKYRNKRDFFQWWKKSDS